MSLSSSDRDNDSWLADLQSTGRRRDRAILDLREYLLRAVLVYLTRHRSDLASLDYDELRQLADDWAQLAGRKILDQIGGFRGDSKFTTWAYRVAINLVAGELRRKRWSNVSLEALTESEHPDRRLTLDDSGPSPESSVTREMAWDAIMEAIENDLTERQARVLRRVVLDGADVEVVAVELETNRNNIYKLVHDARKKLKRAMLDRNWSAEEILAAFSPVDAV